MKPLLVGAGLSGEEDLMSVEFDTNHSGLDAVLDSINITIDGTTIEIENQSQGRLFQTVKISPKMKNCRCCGVGR